MAYDILNFKNTKKRYVDVNQFGNNVMGNVFTFQSALARYREHHIFKFDFDTDGNKILDCTVLMKFLVWMNPKEEKIKRVISKLRSLGYYKTKRRLSRSLRIHIMYKQEYKCKTCNELLRPDCHIDHTVKLEDGGLDEESNLQALCVPCHMIKTYNERHAAVTLGNFDSYKYNKVSKKRRLD